MSVVNDGVVRQVDDEIRIFDKIAMLFGHGRCRRLHRQLVAPQNGFDSGNQLFRIKRFDHVVVGAQLQPQHLIKDFALGGEHDDWHLGGASQFPADLIAVDARKHQIKENQVGLKFGKYPESFFPVSDNFRFKTFFRQVK